MAAGICLKRRRNLAQAGLISSVADAALAIDFGRKGFATRGKEHEGRISYERGIFAALSVFRDAVSTADPQTIILAEYTFISQELQFCETDKDAFSSLTKAIQSFDDAFLALQAVEDSALYQGAEKTHPHSDKYRVHGLPKDSFRIACIGHRTRLFLRRCFYKACTFFVFYPSENVGDLSRSSWHKLRSSFRFISNH